MMRKIYLLVGMTLALVLCANGVQAASGHVKWHGYQAGLAAAKKAGKKIFLYFHAPWCMYCKEMDKTTFTNKEVAAYLNAHFIPVLVNMEANRKTAREYRVRGLPANFFLTAQSDIITLPLQGTQKVKQINGYLPPTMFLKLIHYVDTGGYRTRTFRDYVENP
jgi:thioredoxin-related protein